MPGDYQLERQGRQGDSVALANRGGIFVLGSAKQVLELWQIVGAYKAELFEKLAVRFYIRK